MAPPADHGSVAAARRYDRQQLRRRGVTWLWFGFAVCPCHLPFTLAAVGALLGGTAVGTAITTNPVVVGVVLGSITVVAYLNGMRLVRAAETCSTGSCSTATTTDHESAVLTRR